MDPVQKTNGLWRNMLLPRQDLTCGIAEASNQHRPESTHTCQIWDNPIKKNMCFMVFHSFSTFILHAPERSKAHPWSMATPAPGVSRTELRRSRSGSAVRMVQLHVPIALDWVSSPVLLVAASNIKTSHEWRVWGPLGFEKNELRWSLELAGHLPATWNSWS